MPHVHRPRPQGLPDLEIILNGGVTNLAQTRLHLSRVDGVMIGREAYHNPYILAEADQRVFGSFKRPPSRAEVLQAYLPYVQRELARGLPLHRLTRHILGLFQGMPGAKAWRRHLSQATAHGAGDVDTIREAACHVTRDA